MQRECHGADASGWWVLRPLRWAPLKCSARTRVRGARKCAPSLSCAHEHGNWHARARTRTTKGFLPTPNGFLPTSSMRRHGRRVFATCRERRRTIRPRHDTESAVRDGFLSPASSMWPAARVGSEAPHEHSGWSVVRRRRLWAASVGIRQTDASAKASQGMRLLQKAMCRRSLRCPAGLSLPKPPRETTFSKPALSRIIYIYIYIYR